MKKRFTEDQIIGVLREADRGVAVKALRRLGRLRSQITPLTAQVGAALFDSPSTFAQLLPKLVRSYDLDALDHRLPRVRALAAVEADFNAFFETLPLTGRPQPAAR